MNKDDVMVLKRICAGPEQVEKERQGRLSDLFTGQ